MTHETRVSAGIVSSVLTNQCGLLMQINIRVLIERVIIASTRNMRVFLTPLAKSVVIAARTLNECANNSHDECWKYMSFIQHSTPQIEGGDISKHYIPLFFLLWAYLYPPDQLLCRFCDDLYRISSVTSLRGFQNQRAQTFDGAQAQTIYRSIKRSGIFV